MTKPRYRDTPAGAIAAYAPATEGPFRCDHCRFQEQLNCHKPEQIVEARLLRGLPLHATAAPVEAGGCCDFFKRAPRMS